MDNIEELLQSTGPCLSTDLTQLLVTQCGLTREAARKRVSRQKGSVRRLAYLTFPRNARFVYLQSQYDSSLFWDGLMKALKTSPAYSDAIAALEQHGDLMPKSHFLIACGSPLAQRKHLSSQTVLDRLTQAKLFEEIDVPGIGPCVTRAQKSTLPPELIHNMQARLVVEDITLKAVRTWVRDLGIVSYNKVKIRSEEAILPQVGSFAWDLSAPSYLGGLVARLVDGKPNPGFFVCDIVLDHDHEVTAEGIAPFLRKCQTLRNLKKVGKCIQLFIAEKYNKEAFRLAKYQGIMPGTPKTLFGNEVAASLCKLSEVLRQAASLSDMKVFNELFNGLQPHRRRCDQPPWRAV